MAPKAKNKKTNDDESSENSQQIAVSNVIEQLTLQPHKSKAKGFDYVSF